MATLNVSLMEKGGELLKLIVGHQFGSTRVLYADSGVTADADGHDSLSLNLRLSKPTGNTWPYEDLEELRRAIRKGAQQLEINDPVYEWFAPIDVDLVEDEKSETRL